MHKANLRLPNSEKEIQIKELLSRNDEKFIELNFFEEDELRFDFKMNKPQMDYFVDLMKYTMEDK